jgi:hypothetical protein
MVSSSSSSGGRGAGVPHLLLLLLVLLLLQATVVVSFTAQRGSYSRHIRRASQSGSMDMRLSSTISSSSGNLQTGNGTTWTSNHGVPEPHQPDSVQRTVYPGSGMVLLLGMGPHLVWAMVALLLLLLL